MKVETKPSYGNYSCEFIAHIAQGANTPLTMTVERRREGGAATLYIKVGEVQVVKAAIGKDDDCQALSELFTRTRLYDFPQRTEDD